MCRGFFCTYQCFARCSIGIRTCDLLTFGIWLVELDVLKQTALESPWNLCSLHVTNEKVPFWAILINLDEFSDCFFIFCVYTLTLLLVQ